MADKFLKSITFGKTGEKYVIEDAAAKEQIAAINKKIDELEAKKVEVPPVEGLATEDALNEVEGKVTELENKAVAYREFDNTRKTIELKNHDTISGKDTKGVGHNLAMLSKWDVADFGAPGVHFNLNTKDNVTINDNLVVATTKDVEDAVNGVLALLKEKGVID